MTRFSIAVMLCTACAVTPPPVPSVQAVVPPKLEPPRLRLPEGVRPRAYALDLRVLPGEDTFTGTVTIELELASARDVIWLHAKELTIAKASFTAGGETFAATAQSAPGDFLAVTPSKPLAAGKATLTIAYTGVLSRKDSDGLFQLRDGEQSYAYTQFEPLEAREAFPCFDEPTFKVPWSVTLHVKKEHVALSNTPATAENDEPAGMKAVTFATTQPLPSYLIAFAVGPFEIAPAGTWGKGKTPVRIIVPQGRLAEAKWAVESTGPILEALEQYFSMPYPFEKLDSISLPTPMGAMENPGLVTYGQSLILSKPAEDTIGRQRSYAYVCAHELAHMWFGDLVTMAWWDDLWLNEAFATWMSSKIIAGWKPAWDVDVSVVQRRNGALGQDGLVNARRIRQPIAAPDDIENAFDGITYGKGASVIAMFERWVGADAFQRGVNAYLTTHARSNATSKDFLQAISAAAGKDVTAAFSTFLDQPGAPRIAMTLSCDRGAPPTLALAQRRHLPIGSKGDPNRVWQVPVCVRSEVKGTVRRACTLLTEPTGSLVLSDAEVCPTWVLPNDAMQGYYRASLTGTAELTKLLAKGSALTTPEKVGLLSDVNALVGSGDLDVGTALAAIPLVAASENRHLVGAALGLTGYLSGDLLPEALRPRYQELVRHTFGARAKKLGLTVGTADDEDTRLLRPAVVGLVAIEGKDPALRAQSVKLATAWLTDRTAIHADLVDTVLGIAADTGDAAFHQKVLAAAKVEKERADRMRMLGALAAFHDPALVAAQLPLTLTQDFDMRDGVRLLWGAAGDFRTRELALAFVNKNWDAIIERLPAEGGSGLVWLAGGLCDAASRDQARAFFEGRSTKYRGGPRTLELAMEGIDLCIAWRERQRPSAVAYLQAWKPAPLPTR